MISPEIARKIDEEYFNHNRYHYEYFFKRYGFYKARVLDVGCGLGQNLRFFSKDSIGITYSDDAKVAYVRKKYKLNIVRFNLENEWPKALVEFDRILSVDSIIHLASPLKLLLECRKALKDDGLLLLQIPQSSPFFTLDERPVHPYTFSRKTLLHLMRHAGFESIATYGHIRRLPNWLNMLINPLTRHWGPYVWVVAKKNPNFSMSVQNIRPTWISRDIWPSLPSKDAAYSILGQNTL